MLREQLADAQGANKAGTTAMNVLLHELSPVLETFGRELACRLPLSSAAGRRQFWEFVLTRFSALELVAPPAHRYELVGALRAADEGEIRPILQPAKRKGASPYTLAQFRRFATLYVFQLRTTGLSAKAAIDCVATAYGAPVKRIEKWVELDGKRMPERAVAVARGGLSVSPDWRPKLIAMIRSTGANYRTYKRPKN